MTSDEERRDIAAKLRSYDNSGMALRHALKSLGLPCATMGGNWVKVFDRMAELVEPEERTCHIAMREDAYGDRTEHHDCCGDLHTRDGFTGKPFAYCPNCGAKAIGVDGR